MIRLVSKSFENRGVISEEIIGNLQDEVTATLIYEIENTCFVSDDQRLHIIPDTLLIDTVNNYNVIYTELTSGFQSFKIGDVIDLASTSDTSIVGQTSTIIEKINDQTIRVDTLDITVPTIFGDIGGGRYFVGVRNKFTGINFKAKITKDDETGYLSKINNEIINYSKEILLTGVNILDFTSSLFNKNGTVTVEILNLSGFLPSNFIQQIRVIHKFRIADFYDHKYSNFDQYSQDVSKYKYQFLIEVKNTEISDVREFYESESIGTIGNYNRNLVNQKNNIRIQAVEYKTGTDINGSLELNKTNNLRVNIGSELPITSTNAKVYLSFINKKNNISDYNNINEDYLQNHLFSEVSNSISSIGDHESFILPLSVNFIDSYNIEVSTSIKFGTIAKTNLSSFGGYMIFATVEYLTGERIATRTIVDNNFVFEALPDIDLVKSDCKFLLNPSPEKTGFVYEISTPKLFLTDDVIAIGTFKTSKLEPININRIDFEIIAKKAATELSLDKQSINTTSFLNDPLGAKNIAINQSRGYKMPTKTNIEIKRNIALDTIDDFYYDFNFPFVVRWESWIKSNVSPPIDLFDPSSKTLGVPNNYYHYVSNGYEFIFRINFVFDWNGKTYNDSNDYSIEVNDYLAGDFTNESIKSYDEDGVEILDLGVKFLKGVSKIVASFERIGIPNEKDLQAYFMIEKFEGTGLSDARKTTTARSSIYETIKAIDIEVQPNLILVTGFVDENLLSAGNYTIYCRLFEKVIEVPIGGFVGLGEEPNFLIIDENNNAIII